MHGNWNIKASDPGENLTISISVHHPDLGNYFTASLKAKKFCSSSDSDHAFFFWLMPHKVAVWIYWHVSFISALPSSYCFLNDKNLVQFLFICFGIVWCLQLIFSYIHYVRLPQSCFLQAIKLWWKNVQFIQHPRYAIPAYREEALIRDRKLQQCCGLSDDNRHLQQRESDRGCLAEVSPRDRRFRWTDAKWPWS